MYLCLGWMRAVENSPTLFAIIIGLRPKTIRPTPHPQQMDLLIYFPNFSSQFLITVSLFSMVPVFRAGSLDCRLLDSSILSLNLSSPSALLIVKVYTLLVDPTNRRRRRRSFVIADRVSSSTERVSRTQTVSEFTHEFPLKINFHPE